MDALTAMRTFQVWLVAALGGDSAVAGLMRTAWAWPLVESLHFLGVCLLVGAIGPVQYIYNPSFHLKLGFVAIAGLNAGTFYLTSYRQALGPAASLDAPR